MGAPERVHWNNGWLTTNAPSLNAANFETTLAVDAEVQVCLRTDTQVCPGGGTSTDASLSDLTVNDGTTEHTINLATTPYTQTVGNLVETVTLTATTNHTGASVSAVTLGGTAIADTDFSDGITVPSLAVGDNVIVVTVTAEDGSTTRDYTVTVTREATTSSDLPWSTTMTVGESSNGQRGYSNSIGGEGSLDDDNFAFEGQDYNVWDVYVDVDGKLRFTLSRAVSALSGFTLEIAGETLPLDDATFEGSFHFDWDTTWLTANAPSLSLANYLTTLAVDAEVTVCLRTATQVCPGGGTTNPTLSTDASLSALTVSDGTTEHTIDLATTPYAQTVGNTVETVTLTATPTHTGASVSAVTLGGTAITDTDFTDGITVPSLAEGDNVIVVTVTAEDGSTATYTVTVTREGTTTNSPPVFPAPDPRELSVAENVPLGTDVGAPVTATDPDDDPLTYSLTTSPHSGHFQIDSATGQLVTNIAARHVFNHERDPNVSAVQVVAEDGRGGTAQITVTVSVTDVDEPPDAPVAVTVTGSGTTSLGVSWTAPSNQWRPDIDDYDVQYREVGASSWTDGPQDVTGTNTTIMSVDAGKSYEVQVRATNDEGDGPWALSGGTTSTCLAPNLAGRTQIWTGHRDSRSSWVHFRYSYFGMDFSSGFCRYRTCCPTLTFDVGINSYTD